MRRIKQKTSYRAFKLYCKDKNIKLKEVAARLRISEAALRYYLSGDTQMTEEFMLQTCEYLEADVFELFPESRLVQYLEKKLKITRK